MEKKQKNKTKKVFRILDKVGDGFKKFGSQAAVIIISLITIDKVKKKS